MLDSVGVGELPDATAYGDQGSDTVGNIARAVPLKLATMRSLGFGRIASIGGAPPPTVPPAATGRMAEASAGKDSVTGHWEMMGIVLERPFPVFPDGFSKDIIQTFSTLTGRAVCANPTRWRLADLRLQRDLGAPHRTGRDRKSEPRVEQRSLAS